MARQFLHKFAFSILSFRFHFVFNFRRLFTFGISLFPVLYVILIVSKHWVICGSCYSLTFLNKSWNYCLKVVQYFGPLSLITVVSSAYWLIFCTWMLWCLWMCLYLCRITAFSWNSLDFGGREIQGFESTWMHYRSLKVLEFTLTMKLSL